MKPSRLRSALAAGLVCLGIGLFTSANAQTITFRLGTVDNPSSHSGIGAEAFAAEVERLSGGTMKVDVFHAGQLGTIGDQIKNVLTGAQDMHLLYSEFLTNLIDESKIISAPYVFRDLDHLQRFYTSDIWGAAMDRLASMGAVVIDPDWTWRIEDPRGLIAVRPIETPEDLTGLKLRIWESKTAIDTWAGLGANPIVVPRPEMYLAFKQGLIEGGPETIGIAYDQKNVEVAKYWTRTAEYHQILNILVNKRRFDSLGAEQQAILREAVQTAASAFVGETVRGYSEKKELAEREYGVTILEPDLTPWREKSRLVLEKMEADGVIPAGLVERVQAL